jgi:hypothetical protein
MYGYGTKLTDALGQVATFNFEGLAATWWAGLPQDERDAKTQEWPVLRDYMQDNIMSKRWTEAEWLKLNSMLYRQHGHKDELPSGYLA